MTKFSKEVLIVRCSYLYFIDQLNIQDIAKRLGISRFKVSRYLKEAKERNLITITINNLGQDFETISMKLEEKYDIPRIIVVPVTEDMNATEIRKIIGDKGAEFLQQLDEINTLSITWGRTIANMAETLPTNFSNINKIAELTGGLGVINSKLPSNALSVMFAKNIQASCYQMGGPIIASDTKSARAFLTDESIKRTMKIAGNSDIAISGIATLDEDSMLYHAGVLDHDDFNYLKEQGAVGSIIGRFYDSKGKELNSTFKDRAISVSFKDFLKIPERVILAGNSRKLNSIKGILKGGLATTLVIDNLTAEKLLHQ